MGLLDELDELRARHAAGQLTDEAFAAAKQRLLGSPPERPSATARAAAAAPSDDPGWWPAPGRSRATALGAAPAAPAAAGWPATPIVSAPYYPPPVPGWRVQSPPYAPAGLHVLGRWVQGLLIATGVLFAISSAVGLNA